jgi:hypothetical protein
MKSFVEGSSSLVGYEIKPPFFRRSKIIRACEHDIKQTRRKEHHFLLLLSFLFCSVLYLQALSHRIERAGGQICRSQINYLNTKCTLLFLLFPLLPPHPILLNSPIPTITSIRLAHAVLAAIYSFLFSFLFYVSQMTMTVTLSIVPVFRSVSVAVCVYMEVQLVR